MMHSLFCCVPLFVSLAIVLCGAVTGVTAAVFEQFDLFVSGVGGYNTYRIPTMAVMNDGTILAFAEARKTSSSDSGDIDIVMRSSTDNGQTWSPMQLVYEEGGTASITIGNPTPVVDHITGELYLFFARNNQSLFVMSSVDNGQTFGSPIDLGSVTANFDYDWTRIGSGPTAGIQMSDGRLVVPVWLNQQIGVPTTYRAAAMYSDDHGLTWQAGNVAPASSTVYGTNENAIVELADSTLYMTQRTSNGTPARSTSLSADGGETWSTPEVETGINPAMAAIKTSVMRYSTVGDSEQNVLLYSATGGSSRNDMTVWVSTDEAATWPTSRRVYEGPSGYSELAMATDQTILMLYESGESAYYERITLARFELEWLTGSPHLPIENGDFNDTFGWGDVGSTQTPSGWTLSGERKNAAVPQTGIHAIGGSGTSAYMPAFLASSDPLQREIRQSISAGDLGPSWQMTFDIASEDPGSGEDRSLSLGISHDNGQIALRIVDKNNNGIGDLQYYDHTGSSWISVLSLADSITLDSDVQYDPLVNHITINGHYDQAEPCYDIVVTNAGGQNFSAIGLTGWLLADPDSGDPLSSIMFHTFLSTGDYLIDNVSLTNLVDWIPGDANKDGYVDGSDATILAGYWQQTNATWEMGDFNGDRVVDGSDATILAGYWQTGTPPGSAAVPEPATSVLLIGGLSAIVGLFFQKISAKSLFVGLRRFRGVFRAVMLAVSLLTATAHAETPRFEEQDLFVENQGGYRCYRIPTMVEMPDGTILVFVEGRKNSQKDDGDIDLLMRRSHDGGCTWSEMKLIYEEGGAKPVTIGNPSPVVDRVTGQLHLLFSRDNKEMFVITSSDNGKTFGEPVDLTPVARKFGFRWTRLGPGPTSGIQTSKGRLVVPVWLNGKIRTPDSYRVGVLYSDDHGKTWTAGQVVPVSKKMCGVNESDIIELADGSIYMTQRTNAGTPTRSKSISTDGGATWTEGRFEPGLHPKMSAIKTSLARYSGAKDGEKNRLLYSGLAASDRSRMTVWLSEDETKTWPVSKEIHAGPSGYSELLVTKDRSVLLLYECGEKQKHYAQKIRLARFNLSWLTQKNGNSQ